MRTGYCDLDGSRCITMSQSVAYQVGEHLEIRSSVRRDFSRVPLPVHVGHREFSIAVHSSAFQPSMLDQPDLKLIFLGSRRLELCKPSVVAAGMHLEGVAKALH